MIHLTQLKTRITTRPGIITLGAILILIAVGITGLTGHQSITDTSQKTIAAKAPNKSSASSSAPNSSAPGSPDASGNTGDADKQTAIAAAAQPATDACKLLTVSVAQQLLGSGAAASTPQGTSSLQATDTSISACAYSDGGNTVQLVIRTPAGSLGRSENATVFGSGKPSDAVSITGYGQAAYWDPGEHTLNILGGNNWYIISRGPGGGQTDAETVAALLKSGF